MNVLKINGIFMWAYLSVESKSQSINYKLYYFYLNLNDERRNNDSRKIPWDEVAPQYQLRVKKSKSPLPRNSKLYPSSDF